MHSYDAIRLKHLEQFGELVPELLSHLDWSRERIEQEQTERLRRLVQVACDGYSWHRDRLGHLHAATLSVADLATLPPMTKDDLMSHWDAIVTDPRLTLDLAERHLRTITGDAYLLDTYHVVASGGSSGRRGVFV